MAEFVEHKLEHMIPELEHMEKLGLFEKDEIKGIAKKTREHEYKIQRNKKSKEDYLRYIQYEVDLLKLIKQRREKLKINANKSDIDYVIVNRIKFLYKDAIMKFKEDLRFWLAYIKFCKQLHFQANISRTITQMLQFHQDKPKCWYIAARFELEDNKNIDNARNFFLKGLHFHPQSQLLYTELFELELSEADKMGDKEVIKKDEPEEDSSKESKSDDEMCIPMKRAFVIYQQIFKNIKDVNFIIQILNIAKKHNNTAKLQNKIITDMIQEYTNKPEMWDTMARRELEGLRFDINEENTMEVDDNKQDSLRDRISYCNEIYQAAVKKIKTETMWSLYIDCLLEINQDLSSLPNFKKKLLKSTLVQAHQANKLQEKYYIDWVEMMKANLENENNRQKFYEVLCNATDAVPRSAKLWRAKLKYLMTYGDDETAAQEFDKATKLLGENGLPLWRMKLTYAQAKHPDKVEEVFQTALQSNLEISREMKPSYIEWILLTKGIQNARKIYSDLSLQPPLCLELHKKMAALELIQPKMSVLHARRPHEIAAMQFGKTNIEVWIDYILFEIKHGDPVKVSEIHKRAVKTLDDSLCDTFITEYALIKANSN